VRIVPVGLVESSDRVLSFASTNPSQRDFYPTSGGHIRFKAWKKNYLFYWSMGAEIETWGGNFTSASIESAYIDTFFAQTCMMLPKIWVLRTFGETDVRLL
jgi:hypothetical protein